MIIRTVCGDIQPLEAGITLDHEHLLTHPPADVADLDLLMDSDAAALRECQLFAAANGRAIVEMTTVDYGRDAAALARVSRTSGVHIVAATGFNKGRFADRLSSAYSADQLAEWMIAEITSGVCGHVVGGAREQDGRVRCGLIKVSSSLNGANLNEQRVFAAAIAAHHATGAPVSTHTERGTWALEQVACLTAGGVTPGSILIGHLDLNPDIAYLRAVAATGVNLSFDQFGKEKYLPDATRIELIAELVANGYGAQIMIGGDMARRSYLHSYGGSPGLTHIPTNVAPALERQIGRAALQRILADNPHQWLAFEPRTPDEE